jgi:hypothetical protein
MTMKKKEKKSRDPYNYTNRYWHKELSMLETKDAVDTMIHMGCPSRGTYLAMCIKLGNRTFGPPKETA